MPVDVAIVDPLPFFRYGIGAILSAIGHTVEEPRDVVEWAQGRRDCLILLSLCTEHDWSTLSQLCDGGLGRLVIALVDDGSDLTGARAVRAGARSVLAREVTISALERAVAATLDGEAVMPAGVAQALAEGVRPVPVHNSGLSAQQLLWLRRLAAGSTVARLAEDAGYSERAMFRLLQALYRKLGVQNRIEAVLRAQELGWLRDA